MDLVLKAEKLAKTFRVGFLRRKVEALRDATLDVKRGEVFGLVGPNGAGKTTTIKILTGLVNADRGSGSLLGHPIGSVGARQFLGYLPESPYFYEYLKVEELLHFYAELFGVPSQARDKRISELIERVGLSHAVDRHVRKFSKGMLQRAGLAAALVNDPKLVILDEPKTGLDPIGRADVTQLILELKEANKSVFFASHVLSDVERVCDRVAVMVRGRVVRIGSLDELLDAKILSVEVVVDGLDDEVRDEIESRGVSWRRLNAERVVLTADTPEIGRAVVGEVVRLGAALRSYDERREHLEDLFLRQATKSDDDSGASQSLAEESPS